MRILDEAAEATGAHEFAVEMDTVGEPDGAQVRELWRSAPHHAGHGVPHALVRCEDGKIELGDVRAALERFNASGDDGWHWTADALGAYLLHELCGIALLDCRYPPGTRRGLVSAGD